MNNVFQHRPCNIRYAVHARTGNYTPELLQTHRTATRSFLYINRLHGVDDFGPVPDWSNRHDLLALARCAPQRATGNPALDGIRLWEQADAHARDYRPDEPACAHMVGSLPVGEDLRGWRNLIVGFAEDYLTSQGMVVDWAIHHREESDAMPAIAPHAHLLITTRVYDPAHPDVGKIRQTWLRTANARKALAQKWWERSGIYPASYALAA